MAHMDVKEVTASCLMLICVCLCMCVCVCVQRYGVFSGVIVNDGFNFEGGCEVSQDMWTVYDLDVSQHEQREQGKGEREGSWLLVLLS